MKMQSYEKDSSIKAITLGHPDVHRMIKDLVKYEAENKKDKLIFCTKLANVIKSNFE